ncbi:hypothetical protein [Bacillus horti]|uniref:Uncharacterized protein n=1 Tax=Caldalkalibacillus horti TaxID=77523 RepID=A0ABT9W0D9_9BACI|nr:hypothetical protein [Bacillus horti]MDQ0166718.1 hypothetical protein [Bacillus horti]
MQKKMKLSLWFLSGIMISALILPLISALGMPSYNVLLVSLFGEGSILALGFTLLLITFILVGVSKKTSKLI